MALTPAAGTPLEGGFAMEAALGGAGRGATRVVACCSAALGPPPPGRPAEGSLEVRCELSPMASGAFEPGRGRPAQVEAEARLTRLLERSLRERRAVELESLCESPGRCAWAVRLDVHILNHGGALADAAAAAALAALLAFRLPQVTRDPPAPGSGTVGSGGGFQAHPLDEREGRPLTVHRLPVAVSFAALGLGRHLLADPSAEEESLGGARAVFSVDNARQVTVHAGGSAGFAADQVEHLARVAVVRAEEVLGAVKEAAAEHSRRRVAARVRRKQGHEAGAGTGAGAGADAGASTAAAADPILAGLRVSPASGGSSSTLSSISSEEDEGDEAPEGALQVERRLTGGTGGGQAGDGRSARASGRGPPPAAPGGPRGEKKRPAPAAGVGAVSGGLGDLPVGDPDDLSAALRPGMGKHRTAGGRKKWGKS